MRALGRLGTAAAAALLAAWSLGPWLWALVTSLKPPAEAATLPPLLPSELSLEAYRAVLVERPFPRAVANSLVVAALSTLAALVVGGGAAFALARLPLRGKGALRVALLATSLLPPIALVGPLWMAARALGVRDTWLALVPPYATLALPLTTWFLASYLRRIPVELYHAALLDGCTPLGALRRVLLPLAAPGVAATAALAFLLAWNEFLLALTLTDTQAARTVPVEIALFAGLHEVPYAEVCAASVLATLPVIVLVLVLQRRLLAGLTQGGVRG